MPNLQTIHMEDFSIKKFPEASKGWYWLHVLDSLMLPINVPLAIARGAKAGPIMLAVAGVHGDEFEGMEAIREFFHELNVHQWYGTFIGIPVLNPMAYEGQMRETPSIWDGLNLARTFPGDRQGTITKQLAYRFSHWVTTLLTEDDVFIDFHSAGTRYEYSPLIAFHQTNDRNEEKSRTLANAFGIKNVWRIPDQANTRITFNGFIARKGIPTIATEVRGRGGIVDSDVRLLKDGLERIAEYKGMVEKKPLLIQDDPPFDHGYRSTEWVSVATAGLFRPAVALNDWVEQGQPLGIVLSVMGEIVEELISPVSGTIWALRTFSTVSFGDYVYMIGTKH